MGAWQVRKGAQVGSAGAGLGGRLPRRPARRGGGAQPASLIRSVEGDGDVVTVTCLILGELLIHGRDLARALEVPWVILPDEARVVLSGLLSLLPDYLDPIAAGNLGATIDVRIRGG